MYILNDIAYADDKYENNLKVIEIKIIEELSMLVTFSNKEKRVFDVKELIKYPVYKKLKDFNVFKNAYLENGMIVWDNGNIDVSPETVYKYSYIYE